MNKGFCYTLIVSGLFGRNRTSKRHSVELCPDTMGDVHLCSDELQALVDKALINLKPKAGLRWQVSINPVQYEVFQGVEFRTVSIGLNQSGVISGTFQG